MLLKTPKPPYYVCIFTSLSTENDPDAYQEMMQQMLAKVHEQPGFLGIESARSDIGITTSYWESLSAIEAWRHDASHQEAQRRGKEDWYSHFQVRIAKVERAYEKHR